MTMIGSNSNRGSERARPFVLHVRAATSQGGGPDKTILDSPRFYERFGYDSALVYLHPPGDEGILSLRERAAAAGARLIAVADRGPLDPRSLRELIQICRQERVDVWHGHEPKTDVLGLLVRRFWPMRLVTTVHGWITNTHREHWYKRFDKWSLRFYDRVMCVSEKLQRECLEAGVRPARCALLANGVDTSLYQRRLERAEAKRRCGLGERSMLIGSVGRLSDEKGFDLLIRAVAALAERGADVELCIAGDGPARRRLEQQISELSCRDRFRLLGHVSNPIELYQAFDVFALSSLTEGLPNCVLEAMALETPVVATRVGGVPALVSDGLTGVLVEPGDVDALAAGIQRLLGDERLRTECTQAARDRIQQAFSLEQRMRTMCEVYDGLIASRPRAPRVSCLEATAP